MNADEWKVKNCQFWRDLYVEFDMIKNEEQRVAATTTIYIEACREQMNPRASDPSSPEGFVPADKLGKMEEKKPIIQPPCEPPVPLEKKKEGPDQEMTDFEGKKIDAFDRNKPGWVCCPNCGSVDIHHISEKDGKKRKFCACYDCGIFLNIDSKCQPSIKEMEPK